MGNRLHLLAEQPVCDDVFCEQSREVLSDLFGSSVICDTDRDDGGVCWIRYEDEVLEALPYYGGFPIYRTDDSSFSSTVCHRTFEFWWSFRYYHILFGRFGGGMIGAEDGSDPGEIDPEKYRELTYREWLENGYETHHVHREIEHTPDILLDRLCDEDEGEYHPLRAQRDGP